MSFSVRTLVARCGLLIAGLWLTAVVTTSQALADDQFEPVRQRVAKALVDHNLPSISVAVAHEGKIVWEQGFGWADRENRVPASEHTLFSMASISKPITATGLMVLVQRKSLDLDKPANDYLGDAKLRARVGEASAATLRRVANHTSGLPLHYQFFYADQSFHPPSRDETIARYGNLFNPPGEHYQYSNLGYGVLDYIIERTGGKKYADFMREEVFLPLGMTHASVDVAPGLEPHQAIRYTAEGAKIPFYEFDHPGASAVYCSAHDLARFAMFHMKEHVADQRQILDDAAIDQMQVSTADSPGGRGYGIGWGTGTERGYKVVSHTGGMPGVNTTCNLYPSERLAVIVLANTNTPLPFRLAEMIAKIVLPNSKNSQDSPDDSAGKKEMTFAPSSELLGTWKGKIAKPRGESNLVLTVKDSGDVHVRLGNQLETLLNGPSFQDGVLRGRFASDIESEDARGVPHFIAVELKLRGEVLSGPATALNAPTVRGAFALTHWTELKREAAKEN